MPKFQTGNDKEYKVEAIQDNAIYAKEADGYIPGLYYLVVWKSYLYNIMVMGPTNHMILVRDHSYNHLYDLDT